MDNFYFIDHTLIKSFNAFGRHTFFSVCYNIVQKKVRYFVPIKILFN